MSLALQDPVLRDIESEPKIEDAQLLFQEARQRRRRRKILVVGLIAFGVVCFGITFLTTGGGGHFFGSPPPASGKGPVGGATIQQSPPPSHGQQAPITARPSVCDKGIVFLPPGTKSSAFLLPCYKVAALPPTIKVHRVGDGNEGHAATIP